MHKMHVLFQNSLLLLSILIQNPFLHTWAQITSESLKDSFSVMGANNLALRKGQMGGE